MPGRGLYDAALAFRKTKLWERLYDSELFAVRYADGATGYCCVMGAAGQHFSLALYLGEDGAASYRRLAEEARAIDADGPRREMFTQDSLMCSFEGKRDLEPPDLEELDRFGLKPTGRKAFPFFRRYRPYRYPWFLTDEAEAERLRVALLAAIDVSRRLEGPTGQMRLPGMGEPVPDKRELGFSEGLPERKSLPLLAVRPDARFDWSVDWFPPRREQHKEASPRIEQEFLAARLKRMKADRGRAWLCEVVMLPQAALLEDQPGSAPAFPLVMVCVEERDGFVLPPLLSRHPEDYGRELVDQLCDLIAKKGKPARLMARDERTFHVLEAMAGQIGVALQFEEDLPLLKEVTDELLDHFAGERDEGEEVQDMLKRIARGDLNGVPEEQFAAMIQDMPEDIADRMLQAFRQAKAGAAGQAPAKLDADAPAKPRKKSGTDAPAKPQADAPAKPRKKPAPQADRKGSYVIAVSCGRSSRTLRISAGATLYDLHEAILAAFNFDDDHAHAFFLDNRAWNNAQSYLSPVIEDADRYTPEYRLCELGLRVNKRFLYVFDFGEEWRFSCKVLGVLDEETQKPRVVERVGRAPAQYGKD